MEYNYIEKRYNVMGLFSIEAFAGIKGGMNGNCKDVYFLRMTGVNGSFGNDVNRMDEIQTNKMLHGQGIYNRVKVFPKNIEPDMALRYAACYQKWLESGKEKLHTGKLDETAGVEELLAASCKKVLEVYHNCAANVNASIEKNFVIKLLYWLDELAFDYLKNWNPKQSMKFVAQGVTKEQEYFFCYLLTLLGIDVLLLQNEVDIDEKLNNLHLSEQITLGEKSAASLECYDRQKYMDRLKRTEGEKRESVQAGEDASSEHRPRVILPPARRGTSRTSQSPGNNGRDNGYEDGRAGCGNSGSVSGESGSGGRHVEAGRNAGTPGRYGGNIGSGSGANGNDTRSTEPNVRIEMPEKIGRDRGTGVSGSAAAGRGAQELGFEELALRASSIVMISIHDRNGDIIGSGSGIMIGREGYILTNDHVARGGRFYSVRIENDNNMYKTDEIIKYNSLLDLAVIRIDRKLQPLPIYQGSKPLVRGQKVVAIGSPLGLFNSVSDGIISGFRRMNDVDMIQFTAPISHGSSGGAVLNMYGQVIGVSTAGIDEGQNINLAVGYDFINTFVRGFV